MPPRWVKEKEMDLFNNEVGMNLIEFDHPSLTDINVIFNLCNDLVQDGDLVYLHPIEYYDPTNNPNFWDNPSTNEINDGNHGIGSSTQLIPTDN